MKVSILGSTKEKNILSKEDAITFSGKAAGICYMPDTLEVLFNEEKDRYCLSFNPDEYIDKLYKRMLISI